VRNAELVFTLTFAVIGCVHAQEQPTYTLPLSLANEAAMTAVQQCEDAGYRVTATVVDAAGTVKVIAKGDQSTPHTRDSSYRKAYTVATMAPIFKFDTTSQWVVKLKDNPSAPALASIPDVLPFAGGVAIRARGQLVAAIGVGGAPGGEKDEICAQAGLSRIADGLPK